MLYSKTNSVSSSDLLYEKNEKSKTFSPCHFTNVNLFLNWPTLTEYILAISMYDGIEGT